MPLSKMTAGIFGAVYALLGLSAGSFKLGDEVRVSWEVFGEEEEESDDEQRHRDHR